MAFSEILVIKNGRPLKGARVVLGFGGVINLGHTKSIYTDNNGRALVEHSSSGMATVYIDGKSMRKMNTPGADTFYL